MKNLIIFIIIFTAGMRVQAQSNLTLYNMEPVPQRLSVNPALSPDCKWYISTPGLSSTDLSFGSNAFSVFKLVSTFGNRPNGDFILNRIQSKEFLDEPTFVNFDMNQEWFNVGFRAGKSMLFLTVLDKVKARVSIPNDLLKYVFEGNSAATVASDLNFNFGLDLLHTREFSLGFNRTFLKERLTLGARAKYISGQNMIQTVKNDMRFRINPADLRLDVQADIEVNKSTPFLEDQRGVSVKQRIFGNPSNSGFGLDLGATLDLNKRITLTASIIDLGQIYWNDAQKIKSKKPGSTFSYSGIEHLISDSIGFQNSFQNLSDTLLQIFALETTSTSFSTGLLGEFYMGANLRVNARHNAGALIYGSFYKKQFYPAITFSWNSEFGRFMALSISYTTMRENYSNFGLGLGLNFDAEQFYIASDNVSSAISGDQQNLRIRFGWNHTLGRKEWEDKQKIKWIKK